MTDSAQYTVPRQPGRWRAIALALIVHVALFVFLWVGIRWQNETPLVVEAEIWNPNIKEAAPLPDPEPQPQVPDPTPAVKPVPLPPPPKVDEPPVVKPDIALEQEKKRKDQLKEKLQQQKQEEQKKKELQREQEEQDRLKKQQKQKQQDEERKQDKEKAEADAKKKAAADKVADDKKRKQQEQDAKTSDKRRQDDLKRMMSQAGGTGDATKSQGPRGNPEYASKVAAKIRSNTSFNAPDDIAGNPSVEYAVELLPDGTLRGLRKTKPSGVPGFDEAIQRGIEKAAPYPADKDGKVPSGFTVVNKLKDQ